MARTRLKSNLAPKKTEKKGHLKFDDDRAVKTTAYSDINLHKWRDYADVKTDTF